MRELAETPVRKPRGKAGNKRFLLAYLESKGWDYDKEFKDTWKDASPEERLRFFGKTLPFLFHKATDDQKQAGPNFNIIMANVGSPQDLAKIIMKDPFIDHAKLIEGEVKNAEKEQIKNSPKTKASFLSELHGLSGGATEKNSGSAKSASSPRKRKARVSNTLQNQHKTGGGKKRASDSSQGSN